MIARSYRRPLWVIAALVFLALTVWYGLTRFSKAEPIDIEVIIKSTDDSIEFWQVMKSGIEVAANEFGAHVEVTGSRTEADVDEQIALVAQAMDKKPDAIILAANDSSRLVPVSELAAKRGIDFFIVDSGIDSDIAKSIVATDNIKAGQEAGMQMRRQLHVPGKVAIIKHVQTAASLKDREKGVRSILEGEKGITLLETFDAEGQQENAYEITKKLIREQPDLSGIVGLNEPASVGAGQAIREMNLQDRIKLIGFDSSKNEIKLLEEGVMQATIIQKPFQMGYLSIKTAVDAIRHRSVPKDIDTGSLVITKQNMYDEENQKLLFPYYDK
ncbi:ABC transporter substrate-binding protein [Paenibacillus rhizovicinus]|uniref:ABC transporter substrate-binding protein n=1 Tax=Paenibacillus rhizovicinus TaxID=2704463 RepID=A0A6C0P8C6_9BACL|nr:substrate-binding domain-containing protein [Paenibacillus rhizovicinus]QHW34798.1 ABC transporter substrate-binding protein [Paenibacillus rhizovicinus]